MNGPAQVQVLAEKHSFRDFGITADPLHPIRTTPFKLASTSEYRRNSHHSLKKRHALIAN